MYNKDIFNKNMVFLYKLQLLFVVVFTDYFAFLSLNKIMRQFCNI